VSLADEEAVKRIVVDTLFGLWATVNNLSRLRPSKRERYRITVFGSARALGVPGGQAHVRGTERHGLRHRHRGGPGLMQAANEGARDAQAPERVQSIGIRVGLPFEQEVNPFVEQAFEHETFFTRLHQFVLMSDAYVVAPGGIGTALESMMIWQLMWQGLVDWASAQMLRPGFELANVADLKIPVCVEGADEAIAIIREHHAQWKSEQGRA
jgi:hypothetical protein